MVFYFYFENFLMLNEDKLIIIFIFFKIYDILYMLFLFNLLFC